MSPMFMLARRCGFLPLFLSLFLLACGATQSTDPPPDGDSSTPCVDDVECPDGELCYQGYCIDQNDHPCMDSGACLFDTDCPPAQYCTDSCECLPFGPDGDDDSDNDDDTEREDAPGLEPDLVCLDSVDFGAVPIGHNGEQELVLSNTGETALEIYSIEFDGSTSDEFAIVNPPVDTLVLAPNTGETIVLRYTPANAGIDTGILKIFSNDPDSRVRSVDLLTKYKGTADIEVAPDSLDFSGVRVGETSESQCVTVKNVPGEESDNKVLEISGIHLESGAAVQFELVDPPATPLVLSPVQTVDICVAFHPGREADFADAILIENNDPDEAERPFRVPLSGQGVVPHVEIHPNPIDFGRSFVNETGRIPAEIRNIGGADLHVTAIAVEGVDAAFFQAEFEPPPAEQDGWYVSPETPFPLTLHFTPTETRAYDARLRVESDDPASAETFVSLLGVGAYSAVHTEPAVIDFPLTRLGESNRMDLNIVNDGQISVTVNGIDFGDAAVFGVEGSPFPLDLGIGEGENSAVVTLTFHPEAEQEYTATAEILTNDPNLTLTRSVSGTGALPHLSVPPADDPIQMGEAQLGEDIGVTVLLRNTGLYPMEVTDLAITQGSDSSFRLETDRSDHTIDGNGELSVRIHFAPTETEGVGNKSGAFSFATDDEDHPETNIQIRGRAIQPALLITPTDDYDFGDVRGLTQSDPELFQLVNVGVGDVIIDEITLVAGEGVFFLNGLPEAFPVTLAPQQPTSFTIMFAPPGFSPFNGAVEIETNVFGHETYRIDLQGVGSGCPEGQHLCGEQCLDDLSVDHCGLRCTPCDTPENSQAACRDDNGDDVPECVYDCYPTYWDDCNGFTVDGCEVNTNNDIAHCGGCFEPCTPPTHSQATCSGGECGFRCDDDYHACGETCRADDSIYFCGDACTDCSLLLGGNDETACNGANCEFSCTGTYDDCNDDLGTETGNGCESDLFTDVLHCGDCAANCNAYLHGEDSAACEEGDCAFECSTFYDDCNGDLGESVTEGDGCETLIYDNVAHCGNCGMDCNAGRVTENDAAECIGWNCHYYCINDTDDCNGDLGDADGNGCETSLHTINNCGECNYDCRGNLNGNDSTTCDQGDCAYTCTGDYQDCNDDLGTETGNGCESDKKHDAQHCGDCETSCLPHPDNGAAFCDEGACNFTCNEGHRKVGDACIACDTASYCGDSCMNCNTVTPANATPACTDGNCTYACIENYHRCGNECLWDFAPESCGPNTCTPCPAPSSNGWATCDSEYHCGIECATYYHQEGLECVYNNTPSCCGQSCENCTDNLPDLATGFCDGGACNWSCPENYNKCNGQCISDFDLNNCGGCGNICTPPVNGYATCDGTTCGFGCSDGFHPFGSGCVPNNSDECCGASCLDCTVGVPANSTGFCNNGTCQWTCNQDYNNCGGQCVSRYDLNNCGGCGNVCSVPTGGSATCNGSSCNFDCNAGYEKCSTYCQRVYTLTYGTEYQYNSCTQGTNNLLSYPCDDNVGGPANEMIFKWVADRTNEVVFGAYNVSAFDSVVVGLSNGACSNTCAIISDNYWGDVGEYEGFYLNPPNIGYTYYFAVDGFSSSECGSFKTGIATEEDLGCETTGDANVPTFVMLSLLLATGWLYLSLRRKREEG